MSVLLSDIYNNNFRGDQGFTGSRGFSGLTGFTGSRGIPGPQGQTGEIGPIGFTGSQGDRGTVGNFINFSLIGSGTDLSQLPLTANEGDAWGLVLNDQLTIYVWTSGNWISSGSLEVSSSYPIANTIFVQKYGNDLNQGTSWNEAVLTIERAVELAIQRESPTLIEVGPGTYETQGHIDVPDNTAIVAKHRAAFIVPVSGFEERNVFRLGSGCFIEGFIFENWRIDDLENPTEGFAVSFRPGAVIRRAPYAHKIACRTVPYWGLVPPPLDRNNGNPRVGRGMGVVLADGAVVSDYSTFKNFMTWGATPVSHNGVGYCAKNGALINAVNAVSLWAHRHFYAIDGGQIILSSCSTQFGDYTMYAKGYRSVLIPEESTVTLVPDTSTETAINNASAGFIDDLWNELVAEGYTTGWDSFDELFTRTDSGFFLQSIAWTVGSANIQPMLDFAIGLFDGENTVYRSEIAASVIYSFEYLRDRINALPGVSLVTQNIVTELVASLISTLTTPSFRKQPSLITAIGHTWTSVNAGVALTKVPPSRNATTIRESIIEINEGLVIASGQDDQGNAIFVGGLEISAETGELSGPPFDQAVNRVATKAAIARSF